MLGIINIFVVFFVSVMVSIIGNVIGIGGGVMLVPFFILYLHLTSVVASGLSLFTIVISTLGGAYAFIKQKIFNYKLFIVLIFSILPGVIVGSIINKFVNTQQFKF
ncbi:MAG: TSUP family transporter, partial [Thermoplasmata archaeon]